MLNHSTVEEIIQTKEFVDFYRTASSFCDFVESYATESKYEFLQVARQNLLTLYDTALKIQWVKLQSNIEYDEKLDDIKFKKLLMFIEKRLGDARYYWHVFDPTNDKDTEAVCGDLVDDIGDIYKDLKYSIMIYNLDKEDCKENAVWQFKFDFDKHWDNHCINALSAIHYYLQNE